MEIEIQELNLPTAKGHVLAVSKFEPKQPNNYAIVISSATGVLQKYYAKFATFFALKGFTVYTFDYHGIGKSDSSEKALKNNHSNATSWGQNDQAAVVAFVRQENQKSKLILVTHSIGGQLLGFNPNYQMLDKVVLVASQTGYWKDFKGFHILKMFLFWHLAIPVLTPIFGYFPAKKLGLFENLPRLVVNEWATWGKHPNYLMHAYNAESHLFDRFKIPLLALSFSKDSYAPKNTVDSLIKLYHNASVQRIHHKPLTGERHVKHFGFFKSWAQIPFWEKCLNYIVNDSYEN